MHGSCNRMMGSYTASNNTFAGGALASTNMGCPQALMQQDGTLAQFFSEQKVAYKISQQNVPTLTFTNAKGEKVEQTEWHRVSAWGKTVDIIEKLLTKGSHVAIEGKLTHRSYDVKDGNKRYITEVVANELVLLSK